jgi:outer membrane protein OmpA-like peptidoglycan-associated protein
MRIKQVALVITSLVIASLVPISPAEATPTWDKALYWVDESPWPNRVIGSLENQSASLVLHHSWPAPTDDAIATDNTNIFYLTSAGITKVEIATGSQSTFLSSASLGSATPVAGTNTLSVSDGWLYWAQAGGIARANISTSALEINFLTTAMMKSAFGKTGSWTATAVAVYGNKVLFTSALSLYDANAVIALYEFSSPTSGTITKITEFKTGASFVPDLLEPFNTSGLNVDAPTSIAITATNIYFTSAFVYLYQVSLNDLIHYLAKAASPTIFFSSIAAFDGELLITASGGQVGLWDVADPSASPNYLVTALSGSSPYGIVAITPAPPAPTPVVHETVSVPPPPQTSVIETATNLSASTEGGSVTVKGKFIAPITNIALDGKNLPQGSWVQDGEKIVITLPARKSGVGELQIFNGQIPLLSAQRLAFVETATPTPTPTPTPSPTPTESSKPTPTETQAATEPSAPTASPLPSTIKVYFDMNSARLVPKSEARVASLVAQLVARQGIVVTVTGYVQPTRVNPNEKALSLARARAVITALKSAGVHGSFIAVAGGTAPENTASSRYAKIEITQK